MLSTVTRIFLVAGSLWAIADACLGLEHSWILYLHRVLAPLSSAFVSVLGLVAFCFKSLRTRVIICLWLLLLAACAAPVARSLMHDPPAKPRIVDKPPTVRVLNFNTLGHTDRADRIIAEIARQQPDIVTLQEVNPQLARTLQTELLSSYPCQQLDPAPGSWGMGVLAKERCTPVVFSSSDAWVGRPQLVRVERPGRLPLLVINIHAVHPHVYFRPVPCCSEVSGLTDTVRAREASIQNIFKVSRSVPSSAVILAGDLNATMRNTVYEKIRALGMADSWRELHGATSGATWPSPEFIGMRILGWLLRIDFVFHCAALQPIHAELLSEELGSDHRGIVVDFSEQAT